MGRADESLSKFLEVLDRAAPSAVRTLSRELGIPRRAAGDALAAAAGLGLCGLARHRRKRPSDPDAAAGVVAKFGRPVDLAAPEAGLPAHLGKPGLSARLGGLLGDAGPKAAAWIAGRRARGAEEAVGRALAASMSLVLGALEEALDRAAIAELVAGVPEEPLEDPSRLARGRAPSAKAYRHVARHGRSFLARALGLGG
jgi:hypothetical protein